MPITTTISLSVMTVETLDGNPDGAAAAQRQITHAAFNESIILNATSNPVAQKISDFVETLTAGAATIDLTNLLGTNGAAVNGTGMKLQVLKVKNLGANSLSIAQGASNGYAIGGTKSVPPGGTEVLYAAGGLTAVDATHKTIDLSGTGTQQSQWTLILG